VERWKVEEVRTEAFKSKVRQTYSSDSRQTYLSDSRLTYLPDFCTSTLPLFHLFHFSTFPLLP
jgi:hypothetical protein